MERHPTRFCTPSHPCTILVVDDDDSETMLLRREAAMAYDLGLRFVHVTSLAAGLETMQTTKPALALLDLGLPDSQGLHTLETFVTQTSQRIPVIVFSGIWSREDNDAAMAMGAEHYIKKGECSARIVLLLAVHSIARAGRDRLEREIHDELHRLRRAVETGGDIDVLGRIDSMVAQCNG